MTGAAIALAAALATGTAPPTVTSRAAAGVRILDVEVPGARAAWAASPGEHAVYVAAWPQSGPGRIWRVGIDGSGEPVARAIDVPKDAHMITAAPTLLAWGKGEAWALPGDGGAPIPALDDPDLQWPFEFQGIALTYFPGRLGVWAPAADPDAPWVDRARVALPVSASVEVGVIRLLAAPVRLLDRRADGTLRLATEASADGARRARVSVVTVPPEGGAEVADCWVHFPSAEKLLESRVVVLGGEPALVATTRPADKLSIFGEKLLRVWPLRADRSRLGLDPVLAVESRMNLYQAAIPEIYDADGDGIEDLAVAYWKGIKDDRVVVDVYRGAADGTFRPDPDTSAFDVEHADRSFALHGRDLDGDGVPDLVVEADPGLRVYSGVRPLRRGRLYESGRYRAVPLDRLEGRGESGVRIELGPEGSELRGYAASSGGPRLLDLDGDGRPEVAWWSDPGEHRPARLRIVRLE